MNNPGGGLLDGEVENHRLKRPVDEARKTLDGLTEDDVMVIWRELRKHLSYWVNTRLLDDPRRIPPRMTTHAFQGEFLSLHRKYTDHELLYLAIKNEYTPLIEFIKKHTYQKIWSICILKEAFHGSPDAAFHAAQTVVGANNVKEHQKRQATYRTNASRPKKPNPWKKVFRNEIATLRKNGFTGELVPEAFRHLKLSADNIGGLLEGKSLPTRKTLYKWYNESR